MDSNVSRLFYAIRRGDRNKIRELIKSDSYILLRFCNIIQSSPGYVAAIKYKKVDSLLELISCGVIDKDQINFLLKCAISSAVISYTKQQTKNYESNLKISRQIVEILIDNGAEPNYFNIAISYKDKWMVKLLVEKGVDYKSEEVLYKPIDITMYDIIRSVIDRNDPNIVILGKTILQHAIEYTDSFLVATLVKSGADVNRVNSVLHESNVELAARKGNSRILRILINAGVDIDRYTYYPAIYYAVRNGYLVMTRLLLKHGAKLYIDSKGESLIRYAVACKEYNYVLTKLLFKYGATISGNHESYIKNINERNLYYRSSVIDNIRIINLLIKNGINITDNFTPLYYINNYDSIRIFKKLIKNITDINNVRQGYILDPLVENNKRIKFTKYLITIGAHVEPERLQAYIKDKYRHHNTTEIIYNNLNLLFKAVYHSADKKVKILLDNGANINAPCIKHGTMMRKIYINNYFFRCNTLQFDIQQKKIIRVLIPYLLWSGIKDNNVRNSIEYKQNIDLVNEIPYMKEIKRICDIELKRMKNIILCKYRNIMLYDFLSNKKDDELMVIISNSQNKSIYNNGVSLFKRIFRNRKIELVNKLNLINKVLPILEVNIDKKNRLYYLPTEIKFKVLSYLTCKDLTYILLNKFNQIL
ncbi:SWPV1-018 [Shearwaterpox virus]|uniref:SWPV1-018 n=1 Tax=Shearwaterpox virus TaxID=1974596 RepID=A0A1V0S7M8_CNPV|nr:SWPV1-018 [Shearwaterpox virus]